MILKSRTLSRKERQLDWMRLDSALKKSRPQYISALKKSRPQYISAQKISTLFDEIAR